MKVRLWILKNNDVSLTFSEPSLGYSPPQRKMLYRLNKHNILFRNTSFYWENKQTVLLGKHVTYKNQTELTIYDVSEALSDNSR